MGTGVGGRIRIARQRKGWTQDDLAKKMGKTKSLISKVENGLDNLTSDKISEYAAALGTTPAELMGWDDILHPDIAIEREKKLLDEYMRNEQIVVYSSLLSDPIYIDLLKAAKGCTKQQIETVTKVLEAFKAQGIIPSLKPPEDK